MEEGPVEAVYDSVFAGGGGASVPGQAGLDVDGVTGPGSFVEGLLGGRGGRLGTTNLCNAVDWLPAGNLAGFGDDGGIAETTSHESALGPAIVDACNVPFDWVGSGVAIELVANVDQSLDNGDIDIVDRREVENNSFKSRLVGVDLGLLSLLGAGIVPRTVAWASIVEGIGLAGFGQDCLCKVIHVVVGIGVVEAFGESIDENTRIRTLDLNTWVGAVQMIHREVNVASVGVIIGLSRAADSV